jgi:peptidoglycan/LPS O-acetylase OafA/YrhL
MALAVLFGVPPWRRLVVGPSGPDGCAPSGSLWIAVLTGSSSSDRFRDDINGLRALAVLLVLLFHMKLKDWSGGFVGVDVFFVVSGYLIIPHVHAGLSAGTFSFADFFGKRIRRLVPALLPVVAFVVVVALVALGSGAFRETIGSAAAAAAFVANLFFVMTRGYFDRDVDGMFLLHTWSLGVEFQFYLVVPLILAALPRHRGTGLALGAVASFAVSVWLTGAGTANAYYGLESRFWQLAVGGLIGIGQPRIDARVGALGALAMRVVGLGVILAAALLYTDKTPFPGLAALLPTAAAGLVVAAPAARRDLAWRLLASRPAGWIGSRSYGLYLWHWPLLAVLTLSPLVGPVNDGKRLVAIALAVGLAALSYRLVELPVQRGAFWRRPRASAALFAVPVVAAVAVTMAEQHTAVLTEIRAALPGQALRRVNSLADAARDIYMARLDALGGDGRHRLCSLDVLADVAAAVACLDRVAPAGRTLVVGDSHGRDVFLTLQQAFPERRFDMLHQSACAPARYGKCFPDLDRGLAALLERRRYDSVVFVSHWPAAALAPFAATAATVVRAGVAGIVIGPGPVFRRDIATLVHTQAVRPDSEGGNGRVAATFGFDVRAVGRDLEALARAAGLAYVDRLAALCDAAGCAAYVPGTGALMMFDTQHLTLDGMAFLAERFRHDPALTRILGRPDA